MAREMGQGHKIMFINGYVYKGEFKDDMTHSKERKRGMMEEMQAMYMVRENSRIARDDEYIWFKRCGLIYKAETMVMNNVPVLPRYW